VIGDLAGLPRGLLHLGPGLSKLKVQEWEAFATTLDMVEVLDLHEVQGSKSEACQTVDCEQRVI
jgi:hypothetical protein